MMGISTIRSPRRETHLQDGFVELQIPPLRSPGLPVELGRVDALHAPFPYRKAHTRPCSVQRGRKSGYAPVEMTISFGNAKDRFQRELSYQPDPPPGSLVERSAVAFSQVAPRLPHAPFRSFEQL